MSALQLHAVNGAVAEMYQCARSRFDHVTSPDMYTAMHYPLQLVFTRCGDSTVHTSTFTDLYALCMQVLSIAMSIALKRYVTSTLPR